MPRKCKVCGHKNTANMEHDYINGKAKTKIAREYGVPSQSVDYHMDNHLPDKLVRHVDKKEREHTQDLFANIQSALDEANDILQEARDNKQNRLSLDAIKTILSANELFAKMIAKTKEYESTDRKKKESQTERFIQKGLKVLSDAELETLVQLIGKIHSQNPDHELDPQSRAIVHAMTTVQPERRRSETTHSRSGESRNSQNQGSPEEPDTEFEDTDDWDDFDLELDDLSSEIPSEKTDPKWLRDYRRKNGLF